MTGQVIAVKDKFINDNIYLKKVLPGNTLKINPIFMANPWMANQTHQLVRITEDIEMSKSLMNESVQNNRCASRS